MFVFFLFVDRFSVFFIRPERPPRPPHPGHALQGWRWPPSKKNKKCSDAADKAQSCQFLVN